MSETDQCGRHRALPPLPEEDASSVPDEVETRPFVHRFRTQNNYYIYDVNSMDVLRVDPPVWEIMPDFGLLGPAEILAKYATKHDASRLREALNEVGHAREAKGRFLSQRPEMVFPLTAAELEERAAHQRHLLTLTVTENCNCRCVYCGNSGKYVGRHTWSPRVMSWDIARSAMDDYLRHRSPGQVAVSFYGGEPLMNLRLLERCVAYIREKVPKTDATHFSVTTNGSLLAGEAAAFLAREEFRILVSLDGPREVHDKYRRFADGSPTWQTVAANVRAFVEEYPRYRKEGTSLMFNCILAPPVDVREVESFFQTHELFRGFTPEVMVGFVDALENTLTLPGGVTGVEEVYEKYLDNLQSGRITSHTLADKAYRFQRRFFELPFVEFHKRYERYGCPEHGRQCRLDRFHSPSTCLPGERRLHVDVDGNYWPCERVCESEYLKIGNVRQGVDACKVHQLLRDWTDLNKEECRYCWCLSTCQVGCWQDVCDGSKPTLALKRKACAAHRQQMHRLLIDYCSVLEKNPHAFDFTMRIRI
jgi:uncharacterized protein